MFFRSVRAGMPFDLDTNAGIIFDHAYIAVKNFFRRIGECGLVETKWMSSSIIFTSFLASGTGAGGGGAGFTSGQVEAE